MRSATIRHFAVLRFNTKRTHTQKSIYANQFHHHCSFSFLLISFQEIWKVDWAEIEAREERDSDLPWVIEASILFTVAKIDNNAKLNANGLEKDCCWRLEVDVVVLVVV